MEATIAENAVLDYAKFQLSWLDNSYEAHICCNGVIEKLGHGPLDQLAMHLPKARSSRGNSSVGSFKLDTSIEASSWFTKFTVASFLHIVNVPDVLKLAYAIDNDIFQLEETRKFQIALYAKNHSNHFRAGATDANYLKDASLSQEVKIEISSSDTTKNELLRAMNVRLTALKEELITNFNRAAGIACGIDQISDLALFAQHFGAMKLSILLLKLLELFPNTMHFDIAMKQQTSLNDSVELPTAMVSPTKVSQALWQNSSESNESLDSSEQSSDLDSPHAERSRPVVRSATPRRSASPMRWIQIGKSSSRRSSAVTIKSLNYFPARDKSVYMGDTRAKVNFDDELQFQSKKPERNVGRMSVQDAISLFERKQEETGDIGKRKTADISVSANKSVLRRWSAGLGGSFNSSSHEKASDSCYLVPSSNFYHEAVEKKEDEVMTRFSNFKNVEVVTSDESVVTPNVVESKESTSITEWNQRQEAELNDMVIKMMQSSKPSKYNGAENGKNLLSDMSIDRRGGSYSQYKEKRDEKLRAENARNHTEKQAQLMVLQETLEKSKAAMASKTVKAVVKRESANFSQKPRRNSSPPVLMKKEASKPTGTKNASPKVSSPRTGSLPLGSLKKNGGTLPTKTFPAVSSKSMPSRRRAQPLTSLAQLRLRTEKPLEHMKVNKSGHNVHLDARPSLKLQEDEQAKSVVDNSKIVKPKSALSVEDCGALSKPIFLTKHTKKSTVVPVESKPFLRKGAGVTPSIELSVAKAKDSKGQKLDDSSKNGGILVIQQEIETNAAPALLTVEVIVDDFVEPTIAGDKFLATSLDDVLYNETTGNIDGLIEIENSVENMAKPLIGEICYDDDLGISAAAWVETEHEEYSIPCSSGMHRLSPTIAPIASSSSRVRHSLSQMLQAENGEPEIIEWGNAENPPALFFQKDPSKGLKRLLKLARKSKGEGNSTGLSSPSVFSEGEEEHDSKSSDTSLQKASFQGKSYGKPKSVVGETLDDRNYSKKAISVLSGSDKLHVGHISTRLATKATRSFFSLSSFRSSKSSETGPRH